MIFNSRPFSWLISGGLTFAHLLRIDLFWRALDFSSWISTLCRSTFINLFEFGVPQNQKKKQKNRERNHCALKSEVTWTDCNSWLLLLSLCFENTALTKKSKVYWYLHVNLFHCKIYQEVDKNIVKFSPFAKTKY